ncbi:MAG: MFS transporter [Pseudomonadota bacterium]
MFSSPVFGVFMANTLVSFYLLKFSTDVLLMAPAVIGSLLLLARFWDAITDPLAGWLSDRTNTRLGRRRPWLLGTALPFGAAVVMLWSPPETLSSSGLTLWVGAAILLFYTAYTAFRIPHLAFAAELDRGYHDRTRVFAILQIVESLGMFAATGALFFLEAADDPRAFARQLALAMGAFAALLLLLPVLFLRERAEFQGKGSTNPIRAFGDVVKNNNARVLIGVFFLEQIGFSALVVLLPYLSDYVVVSPGRTALYLSSAIAAILISIPAWVVISRRFGKRRAWLWSLSGKVLIFFSIFFFGQGDMAIMVAASVALGLMHGCGAVVGQSLQADVIDWDHAQTGQRKEGTYFAAWNFAQKAAGGLAVWAVGMMLSMTGFVPNISQSAGTITGMLLLASALPGVLHIVAIALLTRFSLDEQQHQAAMAASAESAQAET